ncbi:BTB/POZ domain-containing protein At3g44820 isoform X2 [Aristolochia californica]|uniref:BTB/POZ domain-containing protein At3g44820 isoform X2 n=1 Tax=Aristolochia californica TaxID=171875 RepID=UPI0035E3914B
MALARKASGFYRQGKEWFYNASLPSDITIEVEDVFFHLHKFPLMSKCGRIARLLKESSNMSGDAFHFKLVGCPDYLEMTEEYGEDNLLAMSESYFHKTVLRNWNDCILVLRSLDSVFAEADTLKIVEKSLNALSIMACTDPSLFGWPMMMYGTLQSPGGSILWNGINTGARIRSTQSDWWFEDVSYLNVQLFERLIETMKMRGTRSENLVGVIMHYAQKYLPGLSRRRAVQGSKGQSVKTLKSVAVVDQRFLLESIIKLLPLKKGKSFCCFLLGLLRVGMILGVSQSCQDILERRIGSQLPLATLDSLLLPNYSDSDNLYDTDCIERIIQHFLMSGPGDSSLSPSSFILDESPSSNPLRTVTKLVDNYLMEIAPDVNLKLGKMKSLAEALPDSSRSLDDGLYRAVDIYFKAHPWLSENEKEKLCNTINCQKLSIEACVHASQNDRLPLRFILQVLFFEQLHLKTTISNYLPILDGESAPAAAVSSTNEITSQVLQRGGWVTVVRENQVLRVDLERMKSRVRELEQEFASIKQKIRRVADKLTASALSSPRLTSWRLGCKTSAQSNNGKLDIAKAMGPNPRTSQEQPHTPHPRHRKSFSLF